ncbi:MAG: hypothetical protein JXR46_10290 [Calditrichaceae bacterium]|nr:hypothetical protein [Calditrichaceae bacterium]
MDIKKIFETLDIGLSSVLRYSFPAALLIITFALVDPCYAKFVFEKLGAALTIFGALVVGIGLYATHRSLVIPIHHLLGCLLLRIGELISHTKEPESLSPTRWIHSLGVPRFRLFLAYGDLRRWWFNKKEDINVLDKSERNAWDLIHAENGLTVMIAEALLIAWFLVGWPDLIDWRFIISIGLFVFSTISGMQQHRIECAHFKTDKDRASKIVKKFKKK